MAETVTIQIGSFSNFVGGHFWSFQQEQTEPSTGSKRVSPTSVFSEHAVRGRRYRVLRPRLVAVDLRGALRMPSAAALSSSQDDDAPHIEWEGRIEHIPVTTAMRASSSSSAGSRGEGIITSGVSSEVTASSSFYAKSNAAAAASLPTNQPRAVEDSASGPQSEGVEFFTDLFSPSLEQSRHISLIPEYCYYNQHPSDSYEDVGTSFTMFSTGYELTQRPADPSGFWEDLTEKIRGQLELSNRLGVVQVLVDWQSGFGGVGAGVLEWLRDEIRNKSIVIRGYQNEEAAMAVSTSHFEAPLRRVGGALFLSSCLEEWGTEWNSVELSDFNLKPEQYQRQTQQPLDQRQTQQPLGGSFGGSPGRREAHACDNNPRPRMSPLLIPPSSLPRRTTPHLASALPGLTLHVLSSPYRLEYGSVYAGRELFESINLGKTNSLMMSYISSPVVAEDDLFSASSCCHMDDQQVIEHMMWNTSFLPDPSSSSSSPTQNPVVVDPNARRFWVWAGRTNQANLQRVERLKGEKLILPDQLLLPQTFPRYTRRRSTTALGCLMGLTQPSQAPVFLELRDSVDRAMRFGKSEAVGVEKDQLEELRHLLTEILTCHDTPLDFD